MAKDTKCVFCGNQFDQADVREAFTECYNDMFDYDEKSRGRVCFACACHMASSGRWRRRPEKERKETFAECVTQHGSFSTCARCGVLLVAPLSQ